MLEGEADTLMESVGSVVRVSEKDADVVSVASRVFVRVGTRVADWLSEALTVADSSGVFDVDALSVIEAVAVGVSLEDSVAERTLRDAVRMADTD